MEKSVTYFEKPGESNTDELIKLVKSRLEGSNIKYIAIASVSGESALKLDDVIDGVKIINVTHHAGFRDKNNLEISEDKRVELEKRGILTFVGSHALSGVGRGISNKFGGVTPVEIIAASFRMFSQGIKVCAEISIMLADAGLIPVGEEIIAIGGNAHGLDSAAILTPANMTNVFDMKIHEIIAMPRP
ncbi:pyruvate kinase alpha/beta domain-containing protein [Methanobrevibacter filiformis]|uniref:Pyruvate kinase, alpha/beta domain n=1 Tax=Methanobrevibacter filiformis TaxID=55758 RepID=A0A166A0S5_9EURY|nr:pyruvate kinase alpha/beta domain-containing protein [Methanobrevibacter filiformis]KZX11421.1 pyruvate kinase, alpha/beta domain [Methanobrevibacter filiformis]